jgi:predicted DsbA family dithiol-disulfide isomerase
MCMAGEDAETLVVYADYVCPFCFLGKTALERYRARRDRPLTVEWRPFDLQAHRRRSDGTIDESVSEGKDEAYFEQARENVRRLAERYDVEMDLELARSVDAWNAHLLASHVRRTIGGAAVCDLNDTVYEALWLDGRDIGDPDVLADRLDCMGLDPALIDEALADDDLAATLQETFEASRRAGISGVPTFAYGDHVARGAVPPDQLERLVDGVPG